ncbi:MAG: SCO6745 family protein [Acidimicrobiales bacterium]
MVMTAQELMDDVCPKIKDNGWAFYFVPETVAKGEELGLDSVTFYVLGRGGVLGDVDWQLVQSAFGYFKPSLIRDTWLAGTAKVAPRDAAAAYMECCREHGRRKLAGLDGLDAFNDAAAAVNEAAPIEGLALYAGIKSFALAGDAPARAMQLVTTLRELRGSVHLLAILASGLNPLEAHYSSRPEALRMFGWDTDEAPSLTDRHRSRMGAAEELTDSLVLPAYSVLDERGTRAMVDGMAAIEAALRS